MNCSRICSTNIRPRWTRRSPLFSGTDDRFRFAFASGVFSSVDPLLIDGWLLIFRDLGTTKQAERKRLWAMPHNRA